MQDVFPNDVDLLTTLGTGTTDIMRNIATTASAINISSGTDEGAWLVPDKNHKEDLQLLPRVSGLLKYAKNYLKS